MVYYLVGRKVARSGVMKALSSVAGWGDSMAASMDPKWDGWTDAHLAATKAVGWDSKMAVPKVPRLGAHLVAQLVELMGDLTVDY